MNNTKSSVRTIIKFQRGSEGGRNANRVFGFVTKDKGHWKGCREDSDVQKKIVLVDKKVANTIIPNAPYKCSLHSMENGNGFVAVSAVLQQYEAEITTSSTSSSFIVRVRFGNKVVVYDPSRYEDGGNVIQEIAEQLRARIDLKDAHAVAGLFIDSACVARQMYQQLKKNVR